MVQYGSWTATTAVEKLQSAHPRGWVYLAEYSRIPLKQVMVSLFRNDQRRWNIAKKVLKQLDRDLSGQRTIPYYEGAYARTRIEELWKYYTTVGLDRAISGRINFRRTTES